MVRTCRICGNTNDNKVFTAREMMLGLRDEFEYFQCAECECLQISEIPESLEKYYPNNYYSFLRRPVAATNKLKRFLKARRLHYFFSGRGIVGKLMTARYGKPFFSDWLRPGMVDPDSRILDVGCGAGGMLIDFYNEGFSDLTGLDPFIEEDLHYADNLNVLKGRIEDAGGTFDLILFNHSFEHIPEQKETLRVVHEKLANNGLALICVPLSSSFAWREYGTDWVQLDAPRHLFLHSIKSMELISKEAGFKIDAIAYESDSFQFLGSEQYKRDIPLLDSRSYKVSLEGSIFTERDVATYERRAKELNAVGDGDQACFHLRKADR